MLSTLAVLALGVATSPLAEPVAEVPVSDQAQRLDELDLDSQTVDESPVLQRWLDEVPDLDTDIRHDSTIRPRLRVGYAYSLAEPDTSTGWIGIEDLFGGDSSLTVSGDYRVALNGDDSQSYGAELRYYLRPLGDRVNLAPVAGYRSVHQADEDVSGLTLGMRLTLALSRNGASDISVSQVWVAPGKGDELGITTVSTGYAIAPDLRIATELQIQSSSDISQKQLGVGLEWMF
ncbi:MAG: hypothetical protein IGR76_03820 [Synechococcales cyanobacterium T60_A2020_003]|nr:hypothetical protein [Synechococcales cyanobacterium T60_A2020_003]